MYSGFYSLLGKEREREREGKVKRGQEKEMTRERKGIDSIEGTIRRGQETVQTCTDTVIVIPVNFCYNFLLLRLSLRNSPRNLGTE